MNMYQSQQQPQQPQQQQQQQQQQPVSYGSPALAPSFVFGSPPSASSSLASIITPSRPATATTAGASSLKQSMAQPQPQQQQQQPLWSNSTPLEFVPTTIGAASLKSGITAQAQLQHPHLTQQGPQGQLMQQGQQSSNMGNSIPGFSVNNMSLMFGGSTLLPTLGNFSAQSCQQQQQHQHQMNRSSSRGSTGSRSSPLHSQPSLSLLNPQHQHQHHHQQQQQQYQAGMQSQGASVGKGRSDGSNPKHTQRGSNDSRRHSGRSSLASSSGSSPMSVNMTDVMLMSRMMTSEDPLGLVSENLVDGIYGYEDSNITNSDLGGHHGGNNGGRGRGSLNGFASNTAGGGGSGYGAFGLGGPFFGNN
ncbi:hypothetical protein BC831DRAFT_487708 [Entophlyctis helioformis]|nr:hypothetical protein BC831DRAFT_487708 [Entophlyctis helioformis]